MNQEPCAMETNSLFEVWHAHLGKLTRHWKVTIRVGDSQGGDQGRELTRVERTIRGFLLSALPSCSSHLCENRPAPQLNTHSLFLLRAQAEAIPDHSSHLTWVSWNRIRS